MLTDEQIDHILQDTDEGLVICSLLTNKLESGRQKTGFWADSPEFESDRFGSFLYKYSPGVLTKDKVKEIEDEAYRALQWLVTDGILPGLKITTRRVKDGLILYVNEMELKI